MVDRTKRRSADARSLSARSPSIQGKPPMTPAHSRVVTEADGKSPLPIAVQRRVLIGSERRA